MILQHFKWMNITCMCAVCGKRVDQCNMEVTAADMIYRVTAYCHGQSEYSETPVSFFLDNPGKVEMIAFQTNQKMISQ